RGTTARAPSAPRGRAARSRAVAAAGGSPRRPVASHRGRPAARPRTPPPRGRSRQASSEPPSDVERLAGGHGLLPVPVVDDDPPGEQVPPVPRLAAPVG